MTPAEELRTTADQLAPQADTRPTPTGDHLDPHAYVAWMLRNAAETCDVFALNGMEPDLSDPWLAQALAVARVINGTTS